MESKNKIEKKPDKKEEIFFYLRKEDFGWMSNFERSPQVINGLIYPTNEHFYQSQKALDPKVQEWIRQAPSAWLAMKAGRALREKEMQETWNFAKFSVMKHGLLVKFTQNPVLREKLLATGNAKIHEKSETDKIWGYKGKDMLGKLLMAVREELKQSIL